MPNFSAIPNIIFDLGGVLLNIKPENSVNQFKTIGLTDTNRIQHEYRENGLFDRLEKGEIAPKVFREEIRQYIDKEVSDEQIDQAWNAMLLDFPKERLLLLQKLSKTHRIYLLSNTNIIHWEFYTNQFKTVYGIDLSDCFVKAYYSHNMGLRKPDSAIYSELIRAENLKAEDCLFIDDMLANAESARSIGMFSKHLDLENGESVLDIFKNH